MERGTVTGAPGAGRSPDAEGGELNATRLLRYAISLQSMVEELRSIPSPIEVDHLSAIVGTRLDEADRFLPPALAAELHRLVAPVLTTGETDRDLKVVLAQLDGWLAGLMNQIGIVVPGPSQSPDAEGQP